ncbi:MAG: polyhydroxyalkanoate depolymerase, partial [Ramlibacter sp.]
EVKGAGHYGIFSGRRWRDIVYPQVRDFILQFSDGPRVGNGAAAKAPAGRKARREKSTA